jgi:hypothetical protein
MYKNYRIKPILLNFPLSIAHVENLSRIQLQLNGIYFSYSIRLFIIAVSSKALKQ